MYPNRMSFDIMPGGGKPPEPVGMLVIKVKKVTDIHGGGDLFSKVRHLVLSCLCYVASPACCVRGSDITIEAPHSAKRSILTSLLRRLASEFGCMERVVHQSCVWSAEDVKCPVLLSTQYLNGDCHRPFFPQEEACKLMPMQGFIMQVCLGHESMLRTFVQVEWRKICQLD